jgi:hypothetical protein
MQKEVCGALRASERVLQSAAADGKEADAPSMRQIAPDAAIVFSLPALL